MSAYTTNTMPAGYVRRFYTNDYCDQYRTVFWTIPMSHYMVVHFVLWHNGNAVFNVSLPHDVHFHSHLGMIYIKSASATVSANSFNKKEPPVSIL